MDRRAFVKACVGVGAATALGAGAAAISPSLARPRGARPPLVRYFGAHWVGGPGPRGVPYVPVTVRDGVFVGKPAFLHGDDAWDALEWLKYCGRATAPGVRHDYAGDDVLRYHVAKERLAVVRPWYADRLGEPIRPEDFPGPGFGAGFAWRSPDPDASDALLGVLVKLAPEDVRFVENPLKPGKPILSPAEQEVVRREVFHEDFVAASSACTHFCCVAGWKQAEKLARLSDAWDKLYCTCHGMVFDLREPVAYEFWPEDREGLPPLT